MELIALEESKTCLERIKQDFLVSATVYQARHLVEFNCDTFVMVSCNGKYKRTRVAYRTDSPYFNEYFSFSLCCSEQQLRRKGILFGLYRTSVCTSMQTCIGQFHVDLDTVWEQEHHAYFKKWGTFEPVKRAASVEIHCGYLLIDLSITSSRNKPISISLNYDLEYEDIERNRLLPRNDFTNELQRVRYSFNIIQGEFISSGEYSIRVTYAGQKIRTNSSAYGRSYRWNETLSFVGTFPSLNQIIALDVLTNGCCSNNVKSSRYIHFSSLSKRTEHVYNLPMFGPTWLYFCSGSQGAQYVGKLLISISTETLAIQSAPAHKTHKTRIYEPLVMANYWDEAVFSITFCIIRLKLLEQTSASHLLVHLSCADVYSKVLNISLDQFNTPSSLNYTQLEAANRQLKLKTQVPDYRHKYFLQSIVFNLREKLIRLIELFKRALQVTNKKDVLLDSRPLFVRLLTQLESDLMLAHENVVESVFKQHTKWDQMRKRHIIQELDIKKTELATIRTKMSSSVTHDEASRIQDQLETFSLYLSTLLHDDQNQYPDIVLHVSRPGHSSADAIARFNMAHYLLPANSSDPVGVLYGKRCPILLRSIHCHHSCPEGCGCIFAKLDYALQIGTERQERKGQSDMLPLETPASSSSGGYQCDDYRLTTICLHCKIHVHQARIFAGFYESDQYNAKLKVLVEGYEMVLTTISTTLSPCWNETIELKNVPFVTAIDGEKESTQKCSILFILQIEGKKMVHAAIGWHDASIKLVRKDPHIANDVLDISLSSRLHTALEWIPLFDKGTRTAEILVSCDINEELPSTEINREFDVKQLLIHGLPEELVPKLKTFWIETFFVGLRQMHKRFGRAIKKSRISIAMGEASLVSGFSGITYGNSADFSDDCKTCSVRLPENPNYWPLIVIKHIVYSNRNEGKTIGIAFLNAAKLFTDSSDLANTSTIVDLDQDEPDIERINVSNLRDMIQAQLQHLKTADIIPKRQPSENSEHNEEFTWWTKFYQSQRGGNNASSVKIYDRELEEVPEFDGFKDWSESYKLHKIKRRKRAPGTKQAYGMVKCKITIHSPAKPSSTQFMPSQTPPPKSPIAPNVQILVVVYVVQALKLTSRDIMSESDSYIVLTYGNQRVRDRAYYIPNQASPVFGRRFEMLGMLPRDQILHLSVYDRDFVSSDDLIGSTYIDIEDRFRSKHFAGFGLPSVFNTRGYNRWRQELKPSEMLLQICSQHGVGRPRIEGGKLIVGATAFDPGEELDPTECRTEQLCLFALNNFQRVPGGFALAPEHVESRSLYHPKRAGIEQGKVQLWIELYETGGPLPPPLDITPHPPKPYELRVIVWNTADVALNERNIFGTEMSDIYVKCWLQEFAEAQHTDVHYRSLTGEGNFNWRMVFPFRYSPADEMLVVRRGKAFYEQYDTELKYPPVLTVQIWDNDSFSADDFLGTVDLTLTRLPPPARTADACKLSRSLSLTGSGSGSGACGSFHLFRRRRVRGWFPVHGRSASDIDAADGRRRHRGISQTGKVELELEILSQEDAARDPVGVGRKPPQLLPEPLRPEVSFNWLRQPAKTFNKLLWPRVRKSFLWIGLLLALCLLLYGLVVNLPTVFVVRSLEQRRSSASSSTEG